MQVTTCFQLKCVKIFWNILPHFVFISIHSVMLWKDPKGVKLSKCWNVSLLTAGFNICCFNCVWNEDVFTKTSWHNKTLIWSFLAEVPDRVHLHPRHPRRRVWETLHYCYWLQLDSCSTDRDKDWVCLAVGLYFINLAYGAFPVGRQFSGDDAAVFVVVGIFLENARTSFLYLSIRGYLDGWMVDMKQFSILGFK